MRYSAAIKDKSLPLYIDSVGNHWNQEDISRKDGYQYVHWLHTQKGVGEIQIDHKKFILEENTGILIRPHIPHAYHRLTKEWETAYFTFGGALVNDILMLLQIEDYLVVQTDPDINTLIESLSEKIHTMDSHTSLLVSGDIYNFLMYIKIYMNEHDAYRHQHENVIQVLTRFIDTHYGDEIRNDDLASLVGYTPQYVTKIFKAFYHCSPYQYMLDIRIRKAKELLANNPLISIQEVCEQTGFHDASYFITAFKKSEKMTPKAFRNLYHKRENLL